jgi:hypothetical protein
MLGLMVAIVISMSAQSNVDATGTIQGVVLNGSQGGEPVANAEVHLRAGVNGIFEPVGKTNTDSFGRFSFEDVPRDPTIIYLPGANRDGVHYPGQRVRLDAANKVAQVRITAYDAVRSVSPLAARRHDIDIDVEKHVLAVTETLLISNRSKKTYVGEKLDDDGLVTLRLSIPPDFDRVTFDSEFIGRRFRIINHQLVTDMPWPPGERVLKFTYRVPIDVGAGQFHRPIDLPTTNLRIEAQAHGQQVTCNVSSSEVVDGHTIFAAKDRELPIGHTIKLQIGNRPIPWMLYGRWGSLAILATLVLGTVLVSRLRKRNGDNSDTSALSKPLIRQGASARRSTRTVRQLARVDRMNS